MSGARSAPDRERMVFMRDFRRSVIRLLLVTAFLLFGAWLALKAMQYRGDFGRMLEDLRGLGVVRFFEGKVVPWFQERFIPFFREQLGPKVEELARPVREFFADTFS